MTFKQMTPAHVLAEFVAWCVARGYQAFEYPRATPGLHMVGSWHYRGLAVDINYPADEATEFRKLHDEVYPEAKRRGLAITFPGETNGYGVANHSIGDGLHLHADCGEWSNVGHGAIRGSWTGHDQGPAVTFTAAETKAIQRETGVKADGVYGPDTVHGVKCLQRRLGVKDDGVYGKKTAAAYAAFIDGVLGKGTVTLWQKVAGTPVDGVISRPSALIKKVQRRHDVKADGILGPQTWKALQRWLGVTADGVPGPQTISALQRALLRGRW